MVILNRKDRRKENDGINGKILHTKYSSYFSSLNENTTGDRTKKHFEHGNRSNEAKGFKFDDIQ